MRKILAALSLCAGAFVSSFAAEPTDLDSLFRGKEYKPVLSASLRDSATSEASAVPGKAAAKSSKSDGYYMLQFESVADFDAAQRRRAQISASTGYAIQVVFDAPFYKLRGGGWANKKAAEDKARELSAYNITAFVVKVK
jgi:cell division protein FtsN